jgi:hypothetical protein
MTEAEILFNQIFKRWTDRQGFILSFRRTSFTGMREATKIIEKENALFVDEMKRGPDYDKLFLDKTAFFSAIPSEKMVEKLTEITISQAQMAADAASIIFAHSFLDGAAFDFCRVTALAAPRDWESLLDQRQIKLSDVRESNYEQILRNKLDEYFEQLERESLLKKIDSLFAKCKPPEQWNPMRNFVFDRERLERLDRYRHDVIHGNGPVQAIPDAEGEVDYLSRMVLFLQGLVNLRYDIRLDPFYVFTGKESPPEAGLAHVPEK